MKKSKGALPPKPQIQPTASTSTQLSCEPRLVREEAHLDTGEHFLVFSIETSVGRKEVRVGRGLLHNRRAFNEELASKGMLGNGVDEAQINALKAPHDERTIDITRRSGWYGDTFVTRFGEFGSRRPGTLFDRANARFVTRSRSGELDVWLTSLEPILARSAELTFAYALALVPPLAAKLDRPGGFCVCYVAESSTGKTTSIRLAQSLTSSAASERELTSFGDTEGAIIKGIVENGGLITGFSDIKTSREKLAGKLRRMVFNATDGAERRGEGDVRPPTASFNLYFLSAEIPLTQLFLNDGLELEKGELPRLVEIKLSDNAAGGIFNGAPQAERKQLIATFEASGTEEEGGRTCGAQQRGSIRRRW